MSEASYCLRGGREREHSLKVEESEDRKRRKAENKIK